MKIKAYHGSSEVIRNFDASFTGKGNDQYGSGFYFASSRDAALAYGEKITEVEVVLNNPFIINGNETANLGKIILENSEEVYRILLHMPSLFNPPECDEMNPLGDYFAEFWECPFNRHEDYQHFIRRLADEYYVGSSLKNLDIFFKDYPTEFRRALKEVLGRDGVVVNFDDGSCFVVAWFEEQITVLN